MNTAEPTQTTTEDRRALLNALCEAIDAKNATPHERAWQRYGVAELRVEKLEAKARKIQEQLARAQGELTRARAAAYKHRPTDEDRRLQAAYDAASKRYAAAP